MRAIAIAIIIYTLLLVWFMVSYWRNDAVINKVSLPSTYCDSSRPFNTLESPHQHLKL